MRWWATILVAALLVGCAPRWEVALFQEASSTSATQTPFSLTGKTWRRLVKAFPDETQDRRSLTLERALWEAGVVAVEGIALGDQSYPWEEIYQESWLLEEGRIRIGDELHEVESIRVTLPPEAAQTTAKLTDLAPTIAGALGVNSPRMTTGRALGAFQVDHVVLIILDGLGYRRYEEVQGARVIPFLDSLGTPKVALTVYPSVTKVGTAAIITGTTPERNGVRDRSKRDTEAETIFDTLAEANKTCAAVEGDALSFNFRHTSVILSGDRDGNGHTDDNTFENAMKVISGEHSLAEGMPDFLWIHFHGIDDVGHTHGPGTDEEVAKLSEVDGYLKSLVMALPPNTLVLICSDHGMHSVREGERLGNHGSLLASDMFVPIWVVQV